MVNIMDLKSTIPLQPPQPWIPSRAEQMRLNALQLAIQNKDALDKVAEAKAYYKFLSEGDIEQAKYPTAERRWWSL